jgi:hypothetical protein
MKKIVALVVAFGFVSAVVGCDSKPTTGTTTTRREAK